MDNDKRDDLRELFGRFSGPDDASRAAEEVQRGQKLLELYPAPRPEADVLASIKRDIGIRLSRRRHLMHRVYRLAPAAAAVILVAIVGLFRHQGPSDSQVSYASLIPTAIWESGDINADDAELAYFNAELEQIEAQINALQTGDEQFGNADAIDEAEVELMRIDTEFWRE